MTDTATQDKFVIDAKGRKTGVVLSLSRYKKLMEDLHDLAVIADRRDEKPISLEEMRRRLKDDGIL
jgi:PHD/YefM family antitoxin component YafN of YafNO toxin-antitoxin module